MEKIKRWIVIRTRNKGLFFQIKVLMKTLTIEIINFREHYNNEYLNSNCSQYRDEIGKFNLKSL